MKRPYVLIPKHRVGKNEFERTIYLAAEEIKSPDLKLIERFRLFPDRDFKSKVLKEDEADEEEYERLKDAIIKRAERLGIKKVEQFEETINLYFNAFEEPFRAAGFYPLNCDWAATLTADIFDEWLNYEVTVMKSKEINHFFTEITDNEGVVWTFDPSAEQFVLHERFKHDYNSSRYEKREQRNSL